MKDGFVLLARVDRLVFTTDGDAGWGSELVGDLEVEELEEGWMDCLGLGVGRWRFGGASYVFAFFIYDCCSFRW